MENNPRTVQNPLNYSKLCGFEQGRVHAIFQDNSSLILQNNNNYATYFFNNGEKIRFELQATQSRDNIKRKLYQILKEQNIYNDKIYYGLEDLYNDQEKTILLNKITSCSWVRDPKSLEKYIKINKADGTIQFNSIDNYASLKLHCSGLIFEVNYLQILPRKKPLWVNKLLYEDANGQSTYNFTKDFLGTIGTTKKSVKDANVMKMGYEYVKITKKYSIFNFPVRWSYPLAILYQKYEYILLNDNKKPKFMPNFNPNFIEWYHTLSIKNEQINEELVMSDLDKIIMKFGITKMSADVIMNELGIPENNPNNDKLEIHTMNKDYFWKDDAKSPLTELYPNNQALIYQIMANQIIWNIGNGETLTWIQLDNSFIISSQQGKFYTHFLNNETAMQIQDDPQLDVQKEFKFNFEMIPQKLRSKSIPNLDYLIKEVIDDCIKITQKSCLSFMEKQSIEIKPSIIPEQIINNDLKHKVSNGIGSFEAYNNNSIKIVFNDRTILRLEKGQAIAKIITKFGDIIQISVDKPHEYEYYIRIALDYFDQAFTDPKVKLERINQTKALQELVNQELCKNEVFLYITEKKDSKFLTNTKFRDIPIVNKENFTFYGGLPLNVVKNDIPNECDDISKMIEREMMKNAEMLKTINLTLKKN